MGSQRSRYRYLLSCICETIIFKVYFFSRVKFQCNDGAYSSINLNPFSKFITISRILWKYNLHGISKTCFLKNCVIFQLLLVAFGITLAIQL